jgi:hypothetical protein
VTGIWTVKVTVNGINISSYSFQVMRTRDEADFAVAQWRDQYFYRNLTFGSFIVAIISFIIAVASLARNPKTLIR